jgi:hypothetical protein
MSDYARPAVSEMAVVEVVPQRWRDNVTGWLERMGEHVNPILVKETRQALKSRQFVLTFALLLICCWAWSVLGLWMMGTEAAYGVKGPEMLGGYYVILTFPLLIIVPFGAFRSLASEQEDHTYELLWITTLKPRQIVSGKLGSSLMQMLIYLSAISPCLAFTYMLRGVSLPTILFMLGYTFLASLGLSMIGLLVGTLSTEKHVQVLLSVLLILGLFLAFYMACVLAFEGPLSGEISFAEPWFWVACSSYLTVFASYFALVFTAAVARITFASDNRSTPLRVVMLSQHVLLIGWIAWGCVSNPTQSYTPWLLICLILAGLHWYVMGALMTGESPELSLRVRRQLPRSFLGRVFLTWFNPGPGTGYLFAVSGSLAALVMVAVAVVIWQGILAAPNTSFGGVSIDSLLVFGALETAYLTIYLGLGLLAIRLLRRLGQAGLMLGLLIQLLLVLLGCGAPMLIDTLSNSMGRMEYSLLQMSNPFWTLGKVADTSTLPVETPVLLVLLPIVALVVLGMNLPGIIRELRHVRIAKPLRVAEEDAELAARFAPAQTTKLSPWDD